MVDPDAMLLDTDILIDLQREDPAAVAWMDALEVLPAVSGIAALELTYGCRDGAELRQARDFLSAFEIVWPTDEDHRRALEAYAPYHLSHGVGALDALIAATAVGRGLTVATFNVRHFGRLPGVRTVQPYTRTA